MTFGCGQKHKPETAEEMRVAAPGRSAKNATTDWRLAHMDDDSTVDLDSVSGGAAKEGAWGKLTLRFTAPDGTVTLRDYTAGPGRPYQVRGTQS